MQRLGPGYSFAQKMAKSYPEKQFGLVVNARGGTSLDEWLPGTFYYKEAIRRVRMAMDYGNLRGVLWHQGESDVNKTETYIERLTLLIDSLRRDTRIPDLPFVAGQLSEDRSAHIPFNEMIIHLPHEVKYTGVALSEGTSTFDNIHFDSKSQRLIGERYGAEMVKLLMAQENWSPEHVYYGPGGKLTYTPDEQGNTIPDFSHVGYCFGDEPIPDIPSQIEIEPVEGDDGATIQAAINSLYSKSPDANGFRGAILLKKGTYQVSGQIKIGASGIVLRGEGDTDEGTVIIAEGTSDRDLIKVDNGASLSVISSSRVPIVESYVPVGRKYVVVSNSTGYAAGNHIVIYRPGTSQWISDLKMNQITATEGVVQWSPSSFSFYFERLITRVNGDTLFFRNPLVMALETQYGGGAVYKNSFNRLQNVGIENLCLKSAYKSNTDEEQISVDHLKIHLVLF